MIGDDGGSLEDTQVSDAAEAEVAARDQAIAALEQAAAESAARRAKMEPIRRAVALQ